MIAEYVPEAGKKSPFTLLAGVMLLAACLCLAACKMEVYGGLSEDQANLMLGTLLKRGIDVVRDVERDAACAVLKMYGELGGANY